MLNVPSLEVASIAVTLVEAGRSQQLREQGSFVALGDLWRREEVSHQRDCCGAVVTHGAVQSPSASFVEGRVAGPTQGALFLLMAHDWCAASVTPDHRSMRRISLVNFEGDLLLMEYVSAHVVVNRRSLLQTSTRQQIQT